VSQLIGDISVTSCSNGIKVINHKKGMSMLTKSPFNEITLFSDHTKKYCLIPFDNFRCPLNRTLSALNNGLLSDTPIEPKSDKTYLQQKVQVFESPQSFAVKQIRRFKVRDIPGRAAKNLIAYCSKDLNQDPHVGLALEHFLGLPHMPGMPLFVEFIDMADDRNFCLKTLKLTKLTVSDNSFKLPASFQKVARAEEIMINEDNSDEIKMMMGSH